MRSKTCTGHWKPHTANSLVRGALILIGVLWWGPGNLAMAAISNHHTATPLHAGAAAQPLQVPPGTFLAGYGRNRQTTGSHDPLLARATVLSDAEFTVALVAVDNIGLTRPDIQRVQQRSAELLLATGLPMNPDHIIVSSTHTHAGPDVMGLWGKHAWTSGRDPALLASWIETIAQVVSTAAKSRQPVHVRAASAPVPQAWVENRSEPDSLDNTLATLALVHAHSGEPIATLTNYACHPTVLGPDNTLSSADWVSGFYETMAANQTGVHLFLQGAIGGWVQPVQKDRTIQEARRYGHALAKATLALQQEATTESAPRLDIATATVHFEMDNFGFQLLMLLGVMERPTAPAGVPADIAWLRIGRSQFLTHPGETAPTYSVASRALLGSADPTFILGLTQDALGYILRPAFFEDDAPYPDAQYLTSVSLGAETGPTLMQALNTLVNGQRAADTPAAPTHTVTGTTR